MAGEQTNGESTADRADYESTPLSRAEYMSALVHLYRGELQRASSWRLRLDTTTNWAVLTTVALLTFSFGEGSHSHWILLLGIAQVSVFMGFEARRLRIAEVWRARVRKIEENFYGPILRRDPQSPEKEWGLLVAEDLFRPRFKIGRLVALRSRLLRNYWAIYAVLLLAWTIKLLVSPTPAQSWAEVRERLGTGLLPWWVPLVYVGVFLVAVVGLALLGPRPGADTWDVNDLPDRVASADL